ncbi:hypothetical protein A2U01_0101964, partial [Trifolium medium]|nr:hypothetical protein [Trifolium medium]
VGYWRAELGSVLPGHAQA